METALLPFDEDEVVGRFCFRGAQGAFPFCSLVGVVVFGGRAGTEGVRSVADSHAISPLPPSLWRFWFPAVPSRGSSAFLFRLPTMPEGYKTKVEVCIAMSLAFCRGLISGIGSSLQALCDT